MKELNQFDMSMQRDQRVLLLSNHLSSSVKHDVPQLRVRQFICHEFMASADISVCEICLSDVIVMFDKSQKLSFVVAEVCLRIEALG